MFHWKVFFEVTTKMTDQIFKKCNFVVLLSLFFEFVTGQFFFLMNDNSNCLHFRVFVIEHV